MLKTLLVLSSLIVFATAQAADPWDDRDWPAGTDPDPNLPREIFHCQDPTDGFFTINASTAYDSEFADDIPAALDGMMVGQVVVYVGEWGELWVDPLGIIMNIYDDDCPPTLEPIETRYFPWGDPSVMEFVYVNDQIGSYDLRVTLFMDPPFQIEAPMSIGFQVDNNWGQDPPYCGIDRTPDFETYGCGEGYVDHDFWGNPRWTTTTIQHGGPVDMAYCLDDEPVTATEQSTWSALKTLFR